MVEVDGLDHGQETDLLVTFHLGKGQDGFMVEGHTGHIEHQLDIIEPSFCFMKIFNLFHLLANLPSSLAFGSL